MMLFYVWCVVSCVITFFRFFESIVQDLSVSQSIVVAIFDGLTWVPQGIYWKYKDVSGK